MKKIVFIEGVSGVGKSTTVQRLCEQLQNRGFSARCYLEGDPNSPLDLCWTAYLTEGMYHALVDQYPTFTDTLYQNKIYHGDYILLRYQIGRNTLFPPELHQALHAQEFCYNPENKQPLSVFTDVFCQLWGRYARSELTTLDYAIFDASLVSHMTNDLKRNYHATTDELAQHLERLLRTIHCLHPIVFYLSTQNVRERVIEARQSRNQPPLTEKQLQFWEQRAEIDIPILARLPVCSHIMDITQENWEEVLTDIVSIITKGTTN